jgi:hypothetical protein
MTTRFASVADVRVPELGLQNRDCHIDPRCKHLKVNALELVPMHATGKPRQGLVRSKRRHRQPSKVTQKKESPQRI